MKFAWKVTLAALVILLLSTGVGSYLLITLSFRSTLEREVDVAQEEMQMLRITYEAVCSARGITLENLEGHSGSFSRTLSENAYFTDHQFRVSTQDGVEVYSTLSSAGDPELLESIDEHASGYIIRYNGKTGRYLVHSAGPMTLPDGVLYLETVRDITSLFSDREIHYQVYRWIVLLVVGVSSAVMFAFSYWLTTPIRSLGRVATQLSQGDYTPRARVTGRDEISELAASFNHMADAIEKNVQELEFKAASYIFSEGKRLENLSLALMSLLVVGHATADVRSVNMQRLCLEAERISLPAIRGKGLSLVVQAEEGSLQGDPALLQMLLQNLLDNARKASEPGGLLVLEGRRTGSGYCLTVSDQGRGIPEAELSKITEAFYMVDKSRSRAEGGAGLGLALCKEIAALHQGSLHFESQLDLGTKVTVELGGIALA